MLYIYTINIYIYFKYIYTYIHIYTHTYICTLHYITLHYITLHYITLHYITYIHTCAHRITRAIAEFDIIQHKMLFGGSRYFLGNKKHIFGTTSFRRVEYLLKSSNPGAWRMGKLGKD